MKKSALQFGRLIFWLAWPFWLIYFRFNGRRSRVLVVADGKLLLVRDWLGGGSWGLPGGGAKRREAIELSAQRELLEEVGLRAQVSELRPLGDYLHSKAGLKFRAYFFLLELAHMPDLNRQRHEVAEFAWFDKAVLSGLDINDDTRHALQEYGHTFQLR